LKKWQTEKPELFVKRVYKQVGLDRYMTKENPEMISGDGIKLKSF